VSNEQQSYELVGPDNGNFVFGMRPMGSGNGNSVFFVSSSQGIPLLRHDRPIIANQCVSPL